MQTRRRLIRQYGRTLTAGTYSLTAVAVDNDGEKTTSSVVSVRVDPAANQPPTVTLTAPANGARVHGTDDGHTYAPRPRIPEGTVARVEFYSGTTLLNSDTTAPYSFSWSSVAAGTYNVKAVVYDNAGASASSATATITVSTGTSNGLVGAYGLNEGTGSVAGDSSGVGPSGTITNATWTAGHFGQALSFAGNGEVNLGDDGLHRAVHRGRLVSDADPLHRNVRLVRDESSWTMASRSVAVSSGASIGSNGTWTSHSCHSPSPALTSTPGSTLR